MNNLSIVSNATMRAETEIASGPDVFFILCEDKNRSAILGTLYSVLMPQDAARFRVWDDKNGFDVLFKLRGRWHCVDAAWRQLKGRNLDPAENHPIAITTFGREVLKKTYGVKERKPK